MPVQILTQREIITLAHKGPRRTIHAIGVHPVRHTRRAQKLRPVISWHDFPRCIDATAPLLSARDNGYAGTWTAHVRRVPVPRVLSSPQSADMDVELGITPRARNRAWRSAMLARLYSCSLS